MFRHPHYLDIPWTVHWEAGQPGRHRHLWWLVAGLVLLALLLVGVGVTSGLM